MEKSKSWQVETPWVKSKGNEKDKSGAVHTPMSRARDLARKALQQKAVKEEMQKADQPAYLRKQKGEKLTLADVKGPRKDSISSKEALAKLRNEEATNEAMRPGFDWQAAAKRTDEMKKKGYERGDAPYTWKKIKPTDKPADKTTKEEVEYVEEGTHILSGDTEFMKKHAKAALEKVGGKIAKIVHDEDSGTSEYHVSHDQRDRIIHASKELEKKGKESYGGLVTKESLDLDEARGRPRKHPVATKPKGEDEEGDDYGPDKGPEPDQNIHQQLKRAADTRHEEVKGKEGYKTKGGAHVTFANGEKHFVHAEHAQKVLSALDKLKPADRSKMHDHIYQSHSNFQAVHKLVG